MFGRTTPRASRWEAGFAVRRDWTVDATHEFVGFRVTAQDATEFAVADRAYWRRGPIQPVHTVVQISVGAFELHLGRRACRAPDCPLVAVTRAVVGGAT